MGYINVIHKSLKNGLLIHLLKTTYSNRQKVVLPIPCFHLKMGFIYVLHKIALREEREGCARGSLALSSLRYVARHIAWDVVLAVFHALLVAFLGFVSLFIRL